LVRVTEPAHVDNRLETELRNNCPQRDRETAHMREQLFRRRKLHCHAQANQAAAEKILTTKNNFTTELA